MRSLKRTARISSTTASTNGGIASSAKEATVSAWSPGRFWRDSAPRAGGDAEYAAEDRRDQQQPQADGDPAPDLLADVLAVPGLAEVAVQHVPAHVT